MFEAIEGRRDLGQVSFDGAALRLSSPEVTAANASKDRRAGDVVASRFRLVSRLGQGTMGSVWAADHLTLKVRVAVKFMDGPTALADKTALLRFEQEARSAASIKSPHVVSILDFGKDASGYPYLAMELLGGEPLESCLQREGRLPLETVLEIVTQACKGLEKAHGAGVLHRDLKPENLFLCKEEDGGFTVKILDFGIAKTFGSNVSLNLTATGQMLGTPIFMSPEQAYGHDIDYRCDLYSLGVVAFNCLTGHLPFEETKTVGELVVAIAMRPPPSITKYRNDLPPAVVEWFDHVMQKSPDKRFQSAREMAIAFQEACAVRKMTVTFTGLEVDETGPPRMDFDTVPRSPPSSAEVGSQSAIVVEAAKRLVPPPEEPIRRSSRPPPVPSHRPPAREGPSVWLLIFGALLLLAAGVGIGVALSRLR
jgi:serine/threonine-protein kinase